MTARCPCCGHEMAGEVPVDALRDVALPPTAKVIIAALADAYPRGLSRQALVQRVYGLKPSGGPLTAENVISVTIARTRPRLAASGWTVSKDHRPGSIRLKRIVKKELIQQAETVFQ